jgi:hypothetical protein
MQQQTGCVLRPNDNNQAHFRQVYKPWIVKETDFLAYLSQLVFT